MLKIKKFILLFVLLIFLLTFTGTASASNNTSNFYVDVNHGNDQSAGSLTHPWKSINHAALKVKPGNTVHISSGNYLIRQNIHITKSGTKTMPIKFTGTGNGTIIDASALDGSDNSKRDGIFIENANYIQIENLVVKNAYRAGIRVSGSDYVSVKHVKSYHNGYWGIFTDFSNHLLIEHNDCFGSKIQHGIYISNSGDYPVIRGNKIHDNANCGLHMNGDISMGGDGIIKGALVENNIIYNNGVNGGSGINCDGVEYSTIRNNLLYNNHASGISLYRIDGGGKSNYNNVYQNTVVVASNGRWALNLKDGSSQNYIYNNILLNNNPSHGSISTDSTNGLQSDYNIITTNSHPVTPDDDTTYPSLKAWQTAGFDKHSKRALASQIFSNPSANDFSLKKDSIGIDSATSIKTSGYDIKNVKRPQGNGYDIGAYEYVFNNSLLKVTSINPSKNAINIVRNPVIKITFNKYVKFGNGWIELKTDNGNSVNILKTIKGNLLTITPKILLSKTTRYTIILHSGCVKDSLNHVLSLYTSSFKTRN